MVSFEIFVKAMPPSLSELKVLPSFCFAFKIPDDVAVTNTHLLDTQEYKGKCNDTYLFSLYVTIASATGRLMRLSLGELVGAKY